MYPKKNIDYNVAFYQRDNPKLLSTLKSITKKREEIRKIAGDYYENRAGNLSDMTTFNDELNKIKSSVNAKEAEMKELPDVFEDATVGDPFAVPSSSPKASSPTSSVSSSSVSSSLSPAQKKVLALDDKIMKYLGYENKKGIFYQVTKSGSAPIPESELAWMLRFSVDTDDAGDEFLSVTLGSQDLELTVDGNLLHQSSGASIPLDESILFVFSARNGSMIKELINLGEVKDSDVAQVAQFYVDIGIISIPLKQGKIKAILDNKALNPKKVIVLQQFHIRMNTDFLKSDKGKGKEKDAKKGAGFTADPVDRLEILIGSLKSGNNSTEIKKEIKYIAEQLHKSKNITANQKTNLIKMYA